MGETISLNIGALESSKNVKISVQCSDKEEMKLAKLLGRFQDVFAWSYEGLHGFDHGLTQHAIPIKEGMKLVRQKLKPINSAFKKLFKRIWKNY